MDHDTALVIVTERLDRLEAENARLRAELGELRDGVSTHSDTSEHEQVMSRRMWLARGAAVAAGAVAGGAAFHGRAAALNGNPVTVGGSFTGTATTLLTSTVPAPTPADDIYAAFRAVNNNSASGTGLSGDGAGFGVVGRSAAASGVGVRGYATNGFGGQFESPWADLVLGGDIARGAPTSDTDRPHTYGEMVAEVDHVGFTSTLWYCTATGLPGNWRRLAGAGTAGALTLLPTPKRVYDSRVGTLPAVGVKSPIPVNSERVVDCTLAGSGVPTSAVGLVLNVTAVALRATSGYMSVRAAGTPLPNPETSNVNFTAGAVVANSVATACAVGAVVVRVGGHPGANFGSDVVVDVMGYYL